MLKTEYLAPSQKWGSSKVRNTVFISILRTVQYCVVPVDICMHIKFRTSYRQDQPLKMDSLDPIAQKALMATSRLED